MSDQSRHDDGNLVPNGPRGLAPTDSVDTLVSRGNRDLAKIGSSGMAGSAQGPAPRGGTEIGEALRSLVQRGKDYGCLDYWEVAALLPDDDDYREMFDRFLVVLEKHGIGRLAELYYHRAHAWFDKGDFDKAITEFDKAIRHDPNDADSHDWRCQAFYERGSHRFDEGDWENAINDFAEVIRLRPKEPHAYFWRGVAYARVWDQDKAIRDLDDAIELEPKDPHAYYERGSQWFIKEEYDNAIRDFNEAIRLDVNFAIPYFERAMIWSAQGKYDEAIKDLSTAIELGENSAATYTCRGIAWFEKQEYHKAVKDFEKASSLDPGLDWSLNKQYDQALRMLNLPPRRAAN